MLGVCGWVMFYVLDGWWLKYGGMDRESVESRMKSEVARYIYDEKRLCPSILLLISLRRRARNGNVWNELERGAGARNEPLFLRSSRYTLEIALDGN